MLQLPSMILEKGIIDKVVVQERCQDRVEHDVSSLKISEGEDPIIQSAKYGSTKKPCVKVMPRLRPLPGNTTAWHELGTPPTEESFMAKDGDGQPGDLYASDDVMEQDWGDKASTCFITPYPVRKILCGTAPMDEVDAKKRRQLWRTLSRIESIVIRAWCEGRAFEVWAQEKVEQDPDSTAGIVHNVVRQLDPTLAEEADDRCETVELLAAADHADDDDTCPGTIGDGEYVKGPVGITMDSGPAAFVMPKTWMRGVELKPSPASRCGQSFVGATGKTAPNVGEKMIEFSVMQGQDRACTFQCSDVNKSLACVTGSADGPAKSQPTAQQRRQPQLLRHTVGFQLPSKDQHHIGFRLPNENPNNPGVQLRDQISTSGFRRGRRRHRRQQANPDGLADDQCE